MRPHPGPRWRSMYAGRRPPNTSGHPRQTPRQSGSSATLGVTPELRNADPNLKITFNVGDIGGPSAGLMMTLAVIDKLTPDR